MGYGRHIRTRYGHGAGKRHGRWMCREDAKIMSKHARRREDRELSDYIVSLESDRTIIVKATVGTLPDPSWDL